MKKIRERIAANIPLQFFLVLIGAISFYVLLSHFSAVRKAVQGLLVVLAPLTGGAILAYFLSPAVLFFETRLFSRMKRAGVKHGLSVFLTLLLLLSVFSALVALIAPQLAQSLVSFLENINEYADTLSKAAEELIPGFSVETSMPWLKELFGPDADYKALIEKGIAWAAEHRDGIIGVSLNAGNHVVQTALSFMFCLYILLDLTRLRHCASRLFKSIMSPERYKRFHQLVARSDGIFLRFFLGNLLDALIIGVMCYIFMLATGLPYGLLVALVVAVTNFVPTFGPIIGAVIGGLLILLVKPVGVIWFLIYTVVSQTLDGNVIKPLLFRDTTGLRPLWVLAAIIIGGGLFGVAGMLLGIPVTAIVSSVLEEHISARLINRGYDNEGNFPATDESKREAANASQTPGEIVCRGDSMTGKRSSSVGNDSMCSRAKRRDSSTK